MYVTVCMFVRFYLIVPLFRCVRLFNSCMLIRFMNERAGRGKAYVPTECEHVANICTHGVCVCMHMFTQECYQVANK